MLKAGIIVESESDWASPVTLVRKRDGGVRWCVDYRKLNSCCVKDAFPLPRIEDCLDTLAGTQFLSTLDMASGYWQLDVAPEDRHKTAFITRFGLFEHVRLAFGLCNAPATYQRAMQLVLQGLLWHKCLVYIDDIICLGEDFETALDNLRLVLERLYLNNLKLKPKKCALMQKHVRYLRRMVSPSGISIAEEHVRKIKEWLIPVTKQEMESFLGFMNYHQEFCKNFADITDSLYKSTASVPKSNNRIDLSEEHLRAIERNYCRHLFYHIQMSILLLFLTVMPLILLLAVHCHKCVMVRKLQLLLAVIVWCRLNVNIVLHGRNFYLLCDSRGCSVIIYLEKDSFCVQIIIVFDGYSASVMSKDNCRGG